jgi:hypothetical protein
MKICPVGAELFHVDRRTDMTKLIFTFCSFANTSKKAYGDSFAASSSMSCDFLASQKTLTLTFIITLTLRKVAECV